MTYSNAAEEGISLVDVFVYALIIVVSIIVFSLVLISISPIDFNGYVHRNLPIIMFIFALMIVIVSFLIVFIYVPEIITGEE